MQEDTKNMLENKLSKHHKDRTYLYIKNKDKIQIINSSNLR